MNYVTPKSVINETFQINAAFEEVVITFQTEKDILELEGICLTATDIDGLVVGSTFEMVVNDVALVPPGTPAQLFVPGLEIDPDLRYQTNFVSFPGDQHRVFVRYRDGGFLKGPYTVTLTVVQKNPDTQRIKLENQVNERWN